MSEFKTIETQEQLDSVIADRIARAKESVRKEYDGWISPDNLGEKTKGYEEQIAALNKTITESGETINNNKTEMEALQQKVAKYETDSVKTRIALEAGIPFEMISKIDGTTEEEIKADAEKMAQYFKKPSTPTPAPLANPEGSQKEQDGVMAAFQKLNPNLKI